MRGSAQSLRLAALLGLAACVGQLAGCGDDDAPASSLITFPAWSFDASVADGGTGDRNSRVADGGVGDK